MDQLEDAFGISNQAIIIFSWLFYCVVCQIVNIFGIVTNIINIICFSKQGFEDSVNISLLGLSASDLGSLLTMIWTCICLTPAVMAADLPFEPMEVMYVTSGMTHLSFTRVSSCITAMITLERCLCIAVPLKVKLLITPRRILMITVGIFIVFFFCGSPVYVVNILGFKFSPLRNKTLVGLLHVNNREEVEKISFTINNFSIPLATFMIIVVCTTILSVKLRNQSKWRQHTINSSQVDKISTRNQKTTKMVMMISILFIICFIPMCITLLAAAFQPDLSVDGQYMNISIIIGGLGYLVESINSSMNIFIYYHISSKYRMCFYRIFRNNKS